MERCWSIIENSLVLNHYYVRSCCFISEENLPNKDRQRSTFLCALDQKGSFLSHPFKAESAKAYCLQCACIGRTVKSTRSPCMQVSWSCVVSWIILTMFLPTGDMADLCVTVEEGWGDIAATIQLHARLLALHVCTRFLLCFFSGGRELTFTLVITSHHR